MLPLTNRLSRMNSLGGNMKKLLFAIALNLAVTGAGFAQKPLTDKSAADRVDHIPPMPSHVVSTGELTPTPEMWFYEQERRRWDDPWTIVRAQAEERAAQRHARQAAMAWYGMSNSRPNVSPDPVDNPFAPHWRSNSYQPAEWVGGGHSTIILEANRGGRSY